MSRPYTPRAAWCLFALDFLVLALAGLAAATQPFGVSSLALGVSVGLTLGVTVMVGEVRKAHRR